MFQIEVNNRTVDAESGETILDVLKRAGIKIPTLCHSERLEPVGRCRVCLVEIEGRSDLVPACSFPVAKGMVIKTHSKRVLDTRKTVVELMLSNHPDDCFYCERNGHCDLQKVAEDLHINARNFMKNRPKLYEIDDSSLSVLRDMNKCILCTRCVRVCGDEVQTVNAIEMVQRSDKSFIGMAAKTGLADSGCINCGQCVIECPTGALTEVPHLEWVIDALNDPEKHVVVQHAPSISVSIAEEVGMDIGSDVMGVMTAALRRIGFEKVFDTSFTADLTIMEEGSELVDRVVNNGTLPMMTSCSPGWVKFVEQFYPDLIDNISTCKSPQQMMGAIIKHFWGESQGLSPDKIYSVSIMPCTAKKYEAARPEMGKDGIPDVDAVLTTRELGKLIRMYGIDLKALHPEDADNPFGERSTAGKLFGASGGVMEAALRSGYFLITGEELEDLEIEEVRGMEGVKETKVKVGDDLVLGVAVASGLGNARKILDQVQKGRDDIHFIEVMTCPGGCIAGGGQPFSSEPENIKKRMQALYDIDRKEELRESHLNPAVQRLYDEFLEEPLGEKSHELLHTHYHKKDVNVK
jgi:NADH-quinone oxidoreductase subunit G/NADP-reducing hydrogenase subunit HndD